MSEVDPVYSHAVALVYALGKASTSLLQRKLNLGYGRAMKILEQMEREGLVGPQVPPTYHRPLLFDPTNPEHLQATWRRAKNAQGAEGGE